ncbi:putative permease [Marinitoga piezophila KA3]|uniref:Putative permease n=1 Tax=Marinitoga piezophila (strain DSM 14283 / JCM 11233 / KA3) TaxID=443254 RepID=H2J7Z2_MARPK|nr:MULTISPECIES: membrane protein [Marinitoga]AEX85483.1 putative permease [Marinitoga piezophila KA3]APT75954.1 membrane protein [Marinitoga sp. 1137]
MLSNPYFLLFSSIFLGIFIGKFKIGRFKLGSSGTLFSGLFLGWLATTLLLKDNNLSSIQLLKASFHQFFLFSLILFISAVGLIASRDIKFIIKKFGSRFIAMAFVITLSGFILSYFFGKISGYNIYNFIGVYSGALTSSPGLATALETVPDFQDEITFGYSVGYIPGVLAVILSMYLIPVIFKIDISKEKEKLASEITFEEDKINNFDFMAFSFVIIVGILLGKININLGIIQFSLGMTGGILISALFLGSLGKVGPINFKMNKKILKSIQELGLLMFLSSVGLKSGYNTFNNLNEKTLILMFFALIIALFSILIGYIIGRYIFKLNWIILSGAICGGMTSTPGLGAAIDANESEEVASGYGATYPFALLGMVIFTKIFSLLN